MVRTAQCHSSRALALSDRNHNNTPFVPFWNMLAGMATLNCAADSAKASCDMCRHGVSCAERRTWTSAMIQEPLHRDLLNSRPSAATVTATMSIRISVKIYQRQTSSDVIYLYMDTS
jgi:hypothetical protein